MAFEDKTLVCKECGKDFVFTAGEQEFYAEKGFENEPARCRDCRDKRRRSRDDQNHGERQMFHVVCAECGKDTEVPFEPKTRLLQRKACSTFLKRFRFHGGIAAQTVRRPPLFLGITDKTVCRTTNHVAAFICVAFIF